MRKTYINHKPSDAKVKEIEVLRHWADQLHSNIESIAPSSRERSVALTKLEECLMWAVKAAVLNDPESVAQEPVTTKE